ncbi:MAG TPA: DUF2934 domain-containing protein [Kofleriaceae bacterium]|nr:DUF2934 domain-containing protein [Kofleriaceae bacterium]
MTISNDKPATRRTKKTSAPPSKPIGADERLRRIAEHAYYLAEARGFESGHELEDWVAAERVIDGRAS